MSRLEDDKILGMNIASILINTIWSKIKPRIVRRIFYPYLVYFLAFVIYASWFAHYDHKKDLNLWVAIPCHLYCVLYSLRQLWKEAWQMIEDVKAYFLTVDAVWNIFDLSSSILVILFCVIDFFRLDFNDSVVLIASIAVLLLWLKLFYFLRIFKKTSSFIRMIIEMFIDIGTFMLIFFIGILAFSNTFYILDMVQLSRTDELTGEVELYSISGDSYFTSIVYVYSTSLGEFNTDDINDHPFRYMYWFLFFGTTIFLMITLLNLIISIMGDSFDRIYDVRKESQLKEICSFISEYFDYFPAEQFTLNSRIIVASLDAGDGQTISTWEGKLGALKGHF
jgi:hypothetical protein